MSTTDQNAPTQGGEGAGVTTPEVTPVPSAAAPEVTPAAPEGETVTIKKSDYDAMIGRQATIDKKEQRVNRFAKKVGYGGSHFGQPSDATPATPAAPASDDAGSVEDVKAERGLLNLALKPEYRAALDADPTFRDLLTQNPLALLPVYASDAFDAEDAIALMTEELVRRAAAVKPAVPAAPATPAPAAPAVPPAGVVNMNDGSVGTEAMKDEQYKEAVKPGTVKGVAAGIKHRLASVGKQH